jgi:hypothetical protein
MIRTNIFFWKHIDIFCIGIWFCMTLYTLYLRKKISVAYFIIVINHIFETFLVVATFFLLTAGIFYKSMYENQSDFLFYFIGIWLYTTAYTYNLRKNPNIVSFIAVMRDIFGILMVVANILALTALIVKIYQLNF